MKCTYCNGTEFYKGPSGGMATNMLCANPDCRHWFNDLGPLGFADLHRVEPTPDEEALRKEAHAKEVALAKLARFKEGADCFAAGRDPETLRSNYAYCSYAESADNVDRLVGYLRAVETKLREVERSHP